MKSAESELVGLLRRTNTNAVAAAATVADVSAHAGGVVPERNQVVWSAECESIYVWCKRLNTLCGCLHAISAAVSLTLAIQYSSFSRTLILEGFNGQRQVQYQGSWSVAPLYLVPAYFLVSTLAHLLLHMGRKKTWPQRWLMHHRNPLRWLEYSLSSSLMILCIGILSGLLTYSSLTLLVVCQGMSIFTGWVMEAMNPYPQVHVTWLPFLVGCIPALACWAAVGIPFFSSIAHVPAFVIGIYVSVFLTFNVFPIVMVYQYAGTRSIPKYLKGECAYMIASLIAKTVLGWQVVGGTLRV